MILTTMAMATTSTTITTTAVAGTVMRMLLPSESFGTSSNIKSTELSTVPTVPGKEKTLTIGGTTGKLASKRLFALLYRQTSVASPKIRLLFHSYS